MNSQLTATTPHERILTAKELELLIRAIKLQIANCFRSDGSLLNTANISKPELTRFAAKVSINEATQCWIWHGYRDPCGYGRFAFGNRTRSAHDFTIVMTCGEIPPGLEVEHLCRVRECCNPDHLETVSHAENIRRRNNPTAAFYKIHGLEMPAIETRGAEVPSTSKTRSEPSHAPETTVSAKRRSKPTCD